MANVKSGDIVVVKDYKGYFLVDEVYEDLVTGFAINGELEGVYGEPDLEQIERVFREVSE